jgi:hypothetical protein
MVLSLAPIGCGKGEMREYTASDGSFRALLYASPRVEERLGNGVNHHLAGNDFADGALRVAYVELHGSARGPEATLNEAQARILKNTGASLTGEEQRLVAGKIPGRLLSADLPDKRGKLRALLFVHGGRRYEMSVIGTEAFVASGDAERFLASFEPLR